MLPESVLPSVRMNSIYPQYLIVVVPQIFTFPVKYHHTNYGDTFPFLINYRVHYTEEFRSLINSHKWQRESSKMLRALMKEAIKLIVCIIYYMLQRGLQNTKYITCLCMQWIGISLRSKWVTLKIFPFTDGVFSLSSQLPPSSFQYQISQKVIKNTIFFTVLSELLDPHSSAKFPARSCSVCL